MLIAIHTHIHKTLYTFINDCKSIKDYKTQYWIPKAKLLSSWNRKSQEVKDSIQLVELLFVYAPIFTDSMTNFHCLKI